MSITFVGFMVTEKGDLIDPNHHEILEEAIMTPELYAGLIQNRVNFDENYQTWQKSIMIEKISTVMGIKLDYDPDKSYVLTVDNLIKILAIQMRFRLVFPFACLQGLGPKAVNRWARLGSATVAAQHIGKIFQTWRKFFW